MIRAATARYEIYVTDKPNMTFEEVVTELVKECTFQLNIPDALA